MCNHLARVAAVAKGEKLLEEDRFRDWSGFLPGKLTTAKHEGYGDCQVFRELSL